MNEILRLRYFKQLFFVFLFLSFIVSGVRIYKCVIGLKPLPCEQKPNKKIEQIGWFNFREKEKKYFDSPLYVFWQYILAPDMLEANVYHEKIICCFTDTYEFDEFINIHSEYKLLHIDDELTAFFILKK